MTGITIAADRLVELEAAEAKLSALEAAGVDNWEGYSHAMQILREEDDAADRDDAEHDEAAIEALASMKVVADAEDEDEEG
jgi:hypothetical protein